MARGEWKALVADDEPAARRGVRQLLAAFPEFAVVGECRNGGEVLSALDTLAPDVVFLDIQMPGIDGLDVIRRRTPDRMPLVVILTAYDQFAIRAFEAQALDYLVKPVSETRFASTISRVTRQLRAASPGSDASLVVATPRGSIVVALRDVDWIEAADNYARIWTGGRSYLVREPLGDLEQRIRAHGFERAHRRALVRLGAVRELTTAAVGGGMAAVLAGGVTIRISRRRRAAFAAAVKRAYQA
jgi:two-component system LytT family response regulator